MTGVTTSAAAANPVTSAGAPPVRPAAAPRREGAPATPVRRQFVSFLFHKLLPEFRRLPAKRQPAIKQLADV